MVFSSIPAYLDPSNWQQQQNHQIIGSSSTNPLLPPPPPPPPSQPHGGGGAGSIRPGSMSERARMANIPMPETALKCPRCESTNTKFCYFNNYSLSQPRHFCKTCRRYWTRGGALRTVPVGGGCRRNKRSKSTSSKSPASGEVIRQNTPNSTSTVSSNGSGAANMLGLTSSSQFQPLRFMSPLSQLTDNFTSGMSLNYTGIPNTSDQMNFNLLGGGGGGGGGGGMASLLSSGGGGGIEPWRMQPFPFLDGLDSSQVGINYQFHGGGDLGFDGGDERSHPRISSSMLTQLESVKMEGNPHELNLSGQFLGGGKMPENNNNNNNNNQWNSTANWSDLSSFRSSSTSNPQ